MSDTERSPTHGQPVDFDELEQMRLRSLANSMACAISEGFGDIVDPREHFYDDPSFGTGRPGMAIYQTTLNDRDDGKYLPVYQSVQDLQIIRAQARNITEMSGGVMGAINTLSNYTLGEGLKVTVQQCATCPKSTSAELVKRLIEDAQRVIDTFRKENKWQSNMDREMDWRSREDGECFIQLRLSPSGQIRASFLEPDAILPPASPNQLDEWLQDEEPGRYSSNHEWSWSFGVHSVKRHPDDPLGYHAVFDPAGYDWDYIPERRMAHIKRNVTRNAKRGISDLYWIASDVQRELKIKRNMADAAALQSAIAWIREHAQGVTAGGVAEMNSQNTRPASRGTMPRKGKLNSGTVIDVPEGQQYKPGPMGAERNPNFVLVAQYVGRAIATRWTMPEFMFTSDASNNNMASSIVAESPFVKAREADQRFYSAEEVAICWKVLRLAHEIGRFAGYMHCFDDVMACLEITASGPRVATRDELATVQRQEAEIRLGTLSRSTAAAEMGRDLAAEEALGARPQMDAGQSSMLNPAELADPAAPPHAGGEMLGQTMVERRRYQANVMDVVDRLQSGDLDSARAKILLDAQGMPPEKVESTIRDALAGLPDEQVLQNLEEPATEAVDVEIETRERPARDFPKGVPTQEDVLRQAAERIDSLYDQLSDQLSANANKSDLRKTLQEIYEVQGQAALAANVVGLLTPFKPTLQDTDAAKDSPVTPLAAVVTDPPAEEKADA